MKFQGLAASLAVAAIVLGPSGCGRTEAPTATGGLTDAEIDNIVRRSYQYVAMYNVNNKFAMKQGGWNTVDADTQLKDHTMREIARPNNDTLYISALLDLRKDPVILEMPAFDSDYVSLMVTGYDHHVNIPMATRLGDFGKPEKILFYTERTEVYDGAPVEGVDLALLLEAGPQVLSIPVSPTLGALAGYVDRFLRSGGWIAWGAAPTEGPIAVSHHRAWQRLAALWRDLVEHSGKEPVQSEESMMARWGKRARSGGYTYLSEETAGLAILDHSEGSHTVYLPLVLRVW